MSKELAKRKNGSLATSSEVNDMFGGTAIQIPIDAPLPQIAIMREKPRYEMPDGTLVDNFEGHIIYWHNSNQYYPEKFGQGSEIPACSSSTGIAPDQGKDKQSGACKDCPMNRYGSANEGTGKACQNTIRLYILIDGEVIPCSLKAPPSSLGRKEALMRWLTSAPNIAAKAGVGTKYQPIKVKFSLHTKDFQGGNSASVIDLETVRVLTLEDDFDELSALAALYKNFMANYFGRISKDVAAEASNGHSDLEMETVNNEDEIPI